MFNISLRILNIFIVIGIFMGVFGWFWMPNMLSGNMPGPYWLLMWYVVSIPIIIGIAFVFLAFIFLYRFILRIVLRGGEDAATLALRNGMVRLLVVALVAGFPGYIGNFEALQQESFGGRYYQLLMQHTNSYASYSVFNCFEPVGMWCESELQTPRMSPPNPTPTPIPDFTLVIDNNPIVVRPPNLPTVTPPAELITDTMGIGLILKVGTDYAVITTLEPTATADPLTPPPSPTFVPVGTPTAPPVVVTIAPTAVSYP